MMCAIGRGAPLFGGGLGSIAVLAAAIGGLVIGVAEPAGAQPAPAVTAAPAASSAEMQRAERMANNPMRAILEAGKLRRRAGAEADAAAVPPATAAPAVPAAPTPGLTVDTAAAPAASVAPPRLGAIGTMAQPPSATVDPLAALPTALTLQLPQSPVTQVAAALQAPAPVQPRLLAAVDPGMPTRVLDEVGSLRSVWVEFDLRADGSVAAVEVLPPAPRSLARVLVPVLQQWRYEPLLESRKHRVELVFNAR